MKVLIIGSGAREHAIAWKFSKSKRISGLFLAPGNAATEEIGVNIPDIDPCNPEEVYNTCLKYNVNHIFVGPETPLEKGIVDYFIKTDIKIVGPFKKAAQLETSKVFSKNFMKKYKIPTAESIEFSSEDKFVKYMCSQKGKWVIKKNGLAAGKGVLESDNINELIKFGKSILKNDSLLVEEYLTGFEVSSFILMDGKHYMQLPNCSDFKKALDNDQGPNTGGMGAICPVPWVDKPMQAKIESEIILPTFNGLLKEGLNYKGVLYFGLMITENGPKLLEYNVRFGDPEAQVLIPRLDIDFGNLIDAMINTKLDTFCLKTISHVSLGVVIASQGYPGDYQRNVPVIVTEPDSEKDGLIFHASTVKNLQNEILTTGGRCFTCVGFGKDALAANKSAYEIVKKVKFKGCWHRNDIGKKFYRE